MTQWEREADRLAEREIVDACYGHLKHHAEKLEGRTDWWIDYVHPADGSTRHHAVECKDRYGYPLAFFQERGLIVDIAKVAALIASERVPLLLIRTADLAVIVIDARRRDGWRHDCFQRIKDQSVRHDKGDQVYVIPVLDSMVRRPDWTAAAVARARRDDMTLLARGVFAPDLESAADPIPTSRLLWERGENKHAFSRR